MASPNIDKGIILNDLFNLLCKSNFHQSYTLSMIENNFLSSLESNQLILFKDSNGRAIGFVNWAFLDEYELRKVLINNGIMSFKFWKSQGEILFFPEFIAPFNNGKILINLLRSHFFPYAKGLAINGKRSTQASSNKILRFRGIHQHKMTWGDDIEEIISLYENKILS